jgi:hypothetical protein
MEQVAALCNDLLQLIGFLSRNNSRAEFPYLFFETAFTCAHEDAIRGNEVAGTETRHKFLELFDTVHTSARAAAVDFHRQRHHNSIL